MVKTKRKLKKNVKLKRTLKRGAGKKERKLRKSPTIADLKKKTVSKQSRSASSSPASIGNISFSEMGISRSNSPASIGNMSFSDILGLNDELERTQTPTILETDEKSSPVRPNKKKKFTPIESPSSKLSNAMSSMDIEPGPKLPDFGAPSTKISKPIPIRKRDSETVIQPFEHAKTGFTDSSDEEKDADDADGPIFFN